MEDNGSKPIHDNQESHLTVGGDIHHINTDEPQAAVPILIPQDEEAYQADDSNLRFHQPSSNIADSNQRLSTKNYIYNTSSDDRPPEKNTSPLSGILSLTKKQNKPRPPKIQASGIVNYGVRGQFSDSESDASSMVSVDSNPLGYSMPSALNNRSAVDLDLDEFDDDASARTPIPKAPPQPTMGAILPSSFLRDRSNSLSNVSDLSEEESSVVKRQKREEENVGRLVQAAKQQQSFAQAWFSAGQSATNALPKYVPPKNKIPSNAPPHLKKKKTSFKIPEKEARSGDTVSYNGPIDLDSGDLWEGDEEDSKKNLEIGSFNFTTHSGTTKKRQNKGFINF